MASSAISSSQNMRASSRAVSVAKRRSRSNSGSAAFRSVAQCAARTLHHNALRSSGYVAELPDHLGIIENSGGRITGATECDGADADPACAIAPSARITAAFGLKHSTGSPARRPGQYQ